MNRPLRIATRPSPLAKLQAEMVADRLGIQTELVVVSTSADDKPDVPLHSMSGRGVFAKEVQEAVLDKRADIAVHSAKDLTPSVLPGLALGAVPSREDPRDVLIGSDLAGLKPGATIATGSVRRRAQLSNLRPDLCFCELRGNIATRLSKVPTGGAVVMALAALRRLGLDCRVSEVLDTSVMLPQVGQGAIAVECRSEDEETLALLAGIDNVSVRRCVDAERSFLAALGGNCDVPVGALASICDPDDPRLPVQLEAMVASIDGSVVLRHCMSTFDPASVGVNMAIYMVEDCGLGDLLGMEVISD